MFLTNKSTVVMALESPAYDVAGETLADADFNVRIKHDVSYSTEIAEYRRKILDGTLDHLTSVMGRQRGTISFTVDMAPSPTATPALPPPWSKLLQACGFKETIYAATGVGWVPHVEQTHVPLTLEVIETLEGASPDQLVTRFQGVMGNVTFAIGTVGEPVQMNFELSGAFVSMVDRLFAATLDPMGLSVVRPGAVLSSCVNVNSIAQDIDSFEINMGNDIQEWIDPCRSTGIKGFYRAGFEPIVTLNPTMKQLATEPGYTQWLAGTTVPLAVSVVSPDGPAIAITAPKLQRITHAPADRNGARISDWSFLCTKNAGNDVLEILQGAKA